MLWTKLFRNKLINHELNWTELFQFSSKIISNGSIFCSVQFSSTIQFFFVAHLYSALLGLVREYK